MAAKQTSPAHMLARTLVERSIVVSWICKLFLSFYIFFLSVAGVGIGVLGAMGIDREAARSTLIIGGGREPGIPIQGLLSHQMLRPKRLDKCVADLLVDAHR